ncbi:MAG: hypothetical protein KGH63_01485, partial [Candidatus Micrarchaeota archaeon]|nr:hypothetical protein [Candidatus Micrarchaeota archaeon]
IVIMFAITQLIAVPAGILLLQASATSPDVAALSVVPPGQADNPLSAVFFVGSVLLSTGAILLLLYLYRFGSLFKWLGEIIIRLLEFSVVSFAVAALLFAYLNVAAGVAFDAAFTVSLLAGLLFALLKFFIPRLKNSAAILSSAGVGALFGFSLGFWPALLFILLLSLYDYIAVFRTRHMLQMAQALGTKSLSFTITADAGGREPAPPKIKTQAVPIDLAASSSPPAAARAATGIPNLAPPTAASSAPRHYGGIDRLDLGSGDLMVPAMLAVSTYTIAGTVGAVAVMAGTILSIALLLRLVVEKRVALPALPPICLGGLVALLIVKLAGF